MNRAWRWRLAFACATAAAAACVPILGLDDLEPRPPMTDAGPDTAVPPVDTNPCTTHAECIDRAVGSPARCVNNVCVNVNTLICNQQILPQKPELLRDESTILVAAFIQGGNPLITGQGLAYQLALDEIEDKQVQGIASKPRHHLAVLVCDADKAQQGVNHVVNDLKLPAIIASFGSGDLAALVTGTIAPAGVFTMNPSITTDLLKYADTGRLVWSLLGTYEDVALAYRPVLDKLIEEKGLGPTVKVALVGTNGNLDRPMADVLYDGPLDGGGRDPSKALIVNDASPPVEQDAGRFRRIKIDSLELGTAPDVKAAKNELLDFEPDVIIAITADELDLIYPEVDGKLYAKYRDAGAGAPDAGPRKGPYWILGPSNASLSRNGNDTGLGARLKEHDEHRARVIGVQFAGAKDVTQSALFKERMILKYGPNTEGLAAENFYDAIYWLAYGFAATEASAPVNGRTFANGVRLLYQGSPAVIPGEPEKIQAAFTAINQHPANGVLYVGALGPPDINGPLGTWNSVGSTYCYPPYQENAGVRYEVRRYSDGGLLPVDAGLNVPLTCTTSN